MNIQSLQKFCLSLPAVTEDVKWGHDLCFSIGGKMFCVTGLEPPFGVSFKVKEEEYEELSSSPGFAPAPYMARAKWVLITEPALLAKKEWEHYLRQSYGLVKNKLPVKIRRVIESGN